MTLDGTPVLLLSPLNFLLSFPLAEKLNMGAYSIWETASPFLPLAGSYSPQPLLLPSQASLGHSLIEKGQVWPEHSHLLKSSCS